jgi:hypothetical protein
MTHPSVEAASAVVRSKIEAMPGPLPPGFLVEVLLTWVRRHLALVHRDEGVGSPRWQEAIELTERLLWSVAPKPDEAARRRLKDSLESLVSGLKAALESAGMPKEARTAFLQELAEVHIARLNPDRPGPYAQPPERSTAADTIAFDIRDPRHARLLDFLNGAEIEQVTL